MAGLSFSYMNKGMVSPSTGVRGNVTVNIAPIWDFAQPQQLLDMLDVRTHELNMILYKGVRSIWIITDEQ